MNVFATSPSAFISALWLDDKRVVKMILETAQILSTIHGGPYKPTHIHHPCTKWAHDPINASWLRRHGIALCSIYTGFADREHKCQSIIESFDIPHTNKQPTHFENCAARASLNISFKNEPDTHLAYRLYLAERWKLDARPPKWTGRRIPEWYYERTE